MKVAFFIFLADFSWDVERDAVARRLASLFGRSRYDATT